MQGVKKIYEAEVLHTVFNETTKLKIVLTKGPGGIMRVDIRYWYKDKNGEWKPTKRGVTLTTSDLESLIGLFDLFYEDFTNDTIKYSNVLVKKERKVKKEEKKEEKVEELKLIES